MSSEPSSNLLLEAAQSSGVFVLTMTRRRVRNALSGELVEETIAAIDTVEAAGVHTLVIAGDGQSFCSGFDLSELDAETDSSLLMRFLRIETMLQRVYYSPLRIVALGHGHIYGAGADLFSACHRRIVDPGAKLRFPGSQFGVALGASRLAARIGASLAFDIVDTGRTIDAAEALACGLATQLAERGAWPEVIGNLAGYPPRIHPAARSIIAARLADSSADADMADIARSASVPGLKARIQAYVAGTAR